MDINNPTPQGAVPRSNTSHRPAQLGGYRPTVDGFAPRRPLMQHGASVMPQPQAQRARPVQGTYPPHHTTPTQHQPFRVATGSPVTNSSPQQRPLQSPQSTAPASMSPLTHSEALAAPRSAMQARTSLDDRTTLSSVSADIQPTDPGRPLREKNHTGHAGLVGFIVFVLLSALLLSPFLPGKIIQNFPSASNTFSTGDSALSCLSTPTNVKSTTAYKTKAGAPITYMYSTSTTQTASCDDQQQSAVTGHTSQFNPLGLVVDIAVAMVVALGIAWVWRLIFGEKRQKRERKD